jgi:type I restriction enzyme, S subunit
MISNWETHNFSDVVFLQEGPGIRKYEYQDDGYPMINVRCVQDGYIDMAKSRSANYELATTKWKHFQIEEGDILFTISGTIGRSAIVKKDDLPLLMNTSVVRFRPIASDLDMNFLYHVVRGYKFQRDLISQSTGTAIKNVGPSHLKKIRISYPPLPEQKRIVAKLDQVFSAIDQSKANVERNLQNAKDLFQSQLAKTFSDTLKAEMHRTFGEVCELVGGSQPSKQHFVYTPQEGYVRLVQVRDYRTDKFMTYIPKNSTKKFCSINDIMIGRYGPPIFGIFSGIEGAYNVALMKAIPDESVLDKNFFKWFLKNKKLQKFVEKSSARAAGQSGVRKELLYTYPVPLPPRRRQAIISNQLDKLFSKSELLSSSYEQELYSLDELKKSILQKAFNGEL